MVTMRAVIGGSGSGAPNCDFGLKGDGLLDMLR